MELLKKKVLLLLFTVIALGFSFGIHENQAAAGLIPTPPMHYTENGSDGEASMSSLLETSVTLLDKYEETAPGTGVWTSLSGLLSVTPIDPEDETGEFKSAEISWSLPAGFVGLALVVKGGNYFWWWDIANDQSVAGGPHTIDYDRGISHVSLYGQVPVPPALFLLGSGLTGLLLIRRRLTRS